jgi:WD40 repeat-containing protein SMU1
MFMADINNGKWDSVLGQVSNMKIPQEKLIDLYEQVALEMIELHEMDTARALLRQTLPMQVLKNEDPNR